MTAKTQRHARVPRGPFAHPIDVRTVPDAGLKLVIEATLDQCAAIASETDLPGLKSLKARLAVMRRAGGRFEVTGRLEAEVTEICVVSLERFDSFVEQPIELMFAPAADQPALAKGRETDRRGRREPASREIVVPAPVPGSDDQVDPPDPIIDDTIDIGAVVVEFLTLARDPYPRKPEAQFDDVVAGDKDDPQASAFAALAQLKDRS